MFKLLLMLILTPSILFASAYDTDTNEEGHVDKVKEINRAVLALEKADNPCDYDYRKIVDLRRQISDESTLIVDLFTSTGHELRKAKEHLEALVTKCSGS